MQHSFDKIANKKLISKLFVRHSSGDKRRNEGMKISIDFVIKLNEEFLNTCQNLLQLVKFQTLTTSPLVMANLQPQSCLMNLRLVNTF